MKFNTEELKTFKARSSFIKNNKITNPILSYLKFDKDGTVIKNNLNAFYRQNIESDKTFLVDEKILMAFVENTDQPTIDIDIKGKAIIISDGKTQISSPTDDPKLFPEYDKTGGLADDFDLTEEMVSAIGLGANYLDEDSEMGAKGVLFIGNDIIAGSDGFIMMVKKFPGSELPKIVLRKEAAAAVGQFGKVVYSNNPSYQFFDTGSSLYGFAKPEQKWIDFSSFAVLEEQPKNFAIDKTGVIQFNRFCLSASASKVMRAKLEVSDNVANLKLEDSSFELEIKVDIPCTGAMEGTFIYNPEYLNRLLTNYPDQLVKATLVKERLYITGASGVTSLIMGIV